MTQCRLRTEEGEEVLSLDELEERLRTGEIPARAWIDVAGLTNGFVRLRDSPLASRWDAVSRARFRATFALDRFPVLALLLALLCVGLHTYVEWRAGGMPNRDLLVELGARARSSILWDGEGWRLFTGALLHRDRWHLGFNVAVFVAVGGALESIYPRPTLVGLLLWGALASSLLSLWVGPQVAVGLSGVVFAALGACVGFGARFRDVLRRPYQQWFGLAALGYALFALWSSASSPDVDHAGHLGGLLAGVLLGLVLPPRRWREPSPLRLAAPGVLVSSVIASVLTLGCFAWHAGRPVTTEPHHAQAAGVILHVPDGFAPTRDAFGLTAFDNGLDAQVALGCARADAVWPRWNGRRGPAEAIARELMLEAPGRDVLDFRVREPRWTTVGERHSVGGWPAQEVRLTYRLHGQDVSARLIAFERGLTRCAVTLATRAGVGRRRGALLDAVRASVQLVPTEALENARRAHRVDPGNLLSNLDLGLAALQLGDVGEAREALLRAAALAPEDSLMRARAHYALGQLGLMTQAPRFALLHARAAHDLAPTDVDAAVSYYGALRANGLGDTPQARELGEALARLRPEVLRP